MGRAEGKREHKYNRIRARTSFVGACWLLRCAFRRIFLGRLGRCNRARHHCHSWRKHAKPSSRQANENENENENEKSRLPSTD